MKNVRHSVERIRPEISHSFDQQFWPVLMSIIVLCSIAGGAIVTLVKGPWMWGSLLILPAAAGVAIFMLYRLNDSVLRRSLQIAILASLAIHLLVLIATSLTFIFGTTIPDQQIVVSNQPERRIVVNNKKKQLVFQKPQKHTVPDVTVEPEKKQSTTQTKPQPIPVVEQEKPVNQQMVERRVTQATVPRMDKQLSKRSRSTTPIKPRTSQTVKTNGSSSAAASTPSATAAKTSVTKKSESTNSTAQKTAASSQMSQRAPETLSSRRKKNSSKIAEPNETATARIRKSVAKIPKVATKKVETKSTTQSVRENSQPSIAESSNATIARKRPTRSSATKSSQPIQAERKSIATASKRNESQINKNVPQAAARKSNRQIAARVPVANNQIQPDSAAASSTNRTRTIPQPKNVAVNRSTSGTIGAGRSRNMERVSGGQPSPTNLPSDSSNKRQSDRMTENIAMSSLQRSERLDRGRSKLSKRALRNENAQWAKRSGSDAPSETTVQAAAASVDSASSLTTNQVAAEKGTSMLDIGATKIVPEMAADRRGGGGMPTLSNAMAMQSEKESGRQSNQMPNVAPTSNSQDVGELTQAEAPQIAAEPNTSDQVGRNAELASSSITRQSASQGLDDAIDSPTENMAGQSARRESSSATEASFPAEQFGEKQNDGNARTRLAQAPTVNRQLEFGSDGNDDTKAMDAVESGDDLSTAEIVRRATDSISSGSMLGTASQVVATSMAGLPLFAKGKKGESSDRRRADRDVIVADGNEQNSNSRSGNALKPKIAAELSSKLDSSSGSNSEPGTTSQVSAIETDVGGIERQADSSPFDSSSVEIALDADDGPGGFADLVSRRTGKISEAITESENVSPNSESRFKRKEFGGVPSVSSNAIVAKEAFRSRNPAALSDSGPKTEAAIENGLEFLARYQLADGSWTLGQLDTDDPLYQNQLNSDAAATGLALLAFQGAGYNHREFKYANQVKMAIDWLVANQSDSGGLYVESDVASNESCRLYSHAIAALALTEAYGMTQDPELRVPTQKALDYIAATQDSKKGGWRYFTKIRMRSSDTSVTGWMMMALKSGKLAGLDSKKSTMDKIEAWLRVAELPNSASEFRYNPYAVDSEGKSRTHGRQASITMTSVGLLMRVYTGWGPNDPRFLKGAEVLLKQLPGDQDSRTRDTYYWYYATQVMKHAGGEFWEKWSSELHPLLVGTQETGGPMRGSWHPYRPVPDRWAPQGGRIYVTTMNLLSLEVKYRLLPLYENTIK